MLTLFFSQELQIELKNAKIYMIYKYKVINMIENILNILNQLYQVTEEEKDRFKEIIEWLDEKILEWLANALYKRLESKRWNLTKLHTDLKLSKSLIEEFKEKNEEKVNLDF